MVGLSVHPIVTLDLHGRILDWNPATTKVIGCTLEQVKGRDFAALLLEQPEAGVFSHVLDKARTEFISPNLELVLRANEGSLRRALADVVPIIGSNGQVSQFVIACTDVTELEQARQSLMECEECYRWLLESSSDSIAVGRGGVIVEANQGFASMTGRELTELSHEFPPWKILYHSQIVGRPLHSCGNGLPGGCSALS